MLDRNINLIYGLDNSKIFEILKSNISIVNNFFFDMRKII